MRELSESELEQVVGGMETAYPMLQLGVLLIGIFGRLFGWTLAGRR